MFEEIAGAIGVGGGLAAILWAYLTSEHAYGRINHIAGTPFRWMGHIWNAVKEKIRAKSLVIKGDVIGNTRELHEYVYESDNPVYIYIKCYYAGDAITQLLGHVSKLSDFKYNIAYVPYMDRFDFAHSALENALRGLTGCPSNEPLPGLILYDPARGVSLEVNPVNENIMGLEGSRVWNFMNCQGRFSELRKLGEYWTSRQVKPIPGVFYGEKYWRDYHDFWDRH